MNRSILSAILLLLASTARAGDWPQILGPQRDGSAVGRQIGDAWPKGGPEVLWQCPAGRGWAGPSVADGRAILFHRTGGDEIVEARDADTGKRLWRTVFPASYVPSYTDDDGPRVVPLQHGGHVWCYGARGDLRCLDAATGRLVWKRDTFADFNSGRPFRGEPPEGYFGIATSPILEGDRLLVNIGGDAKGAGIVAFDAATGKTLWKATTERASYSSPVATTVDGVRHVIFVTRLNVVSVDPATGAVRFQFPFGRSGPTVTAANPVLLDGHLFVTASYGVGSAFARIGAKRADVLWRDPDILASQYTTCVQQEGRLFGVDGRQDGPPAALKCFDPKARKVLWTERSFGYATLIKVDNRLLIMRTDGTLVLAAANPARYEELARAAVSDTTVRALPAFSDGRLYVRDTRCLKCLDLRPAK